MKRGVAFFPAVLFVALLGLVLGGCDIDGTGGTEEYYAVGDAMTRRENRQLVRLLEETGNPERAIILRRLAGNLREHNHNRRMNHLLTSHISANPGDPYNGYYLFLIGRDYQRSGDFEFARRYFRRALNDYPEVNIDGESVHYSVLEALSTITEDPRERIVYYEDLLERFPDRTNEAELHYYMGRTYEDLVNWPRSEDAYRAFLRSPTDIPGASNAESRVRRKLEFANSSRSWTFRALDDLVDIIRRALWNRDVRTLEEHQSNVQFFAASPRQDPLDANSTFGFDIGVFLSRSNVRVAEEFSIRSNEREAYLQTTGWAERFSTWYFYFRRIDFPADPEVHGNWEWAGIRFGEVN